MQSLRCSPAIWAAIPHGRDRPSASRFVAMSIFLLLSKTHTLMPQKLIWATQVAGFRRSLLHHTGCSFWQRRQTENLALPVQRSHWGICGAVPAQTQTMLHSPFGAAYILLVPHPWLWHTPLPWHSRRSEHFRTCGTSVTQLPYIPAHHAAPPAPCLPWPRLAEGGMNALAGVWQSLKPSYPGSDSQTHFLLDTAVFLSDSPCGRTHNWEQKKGGVISVPTALPTQKVEGHTSVPFTTEMLAMKPGKPSHTLDLKIIPKEKEMY